LAVEAKEYRERTGYAIEYYKKNRESALMRSRKAWEKKCAKNGKTPKPYRPLHQRRKDFLEPDKQVEKDELHES
jgi:hypothetical protein